MAGAFPWGSDFLGQPSLSTISSWTWPLIQKHRGRTWALAVLFSVAAPFWMLSACQLAAIKTGDICAEKRAWPLPSKRKATGVWKEKIKGEFRRRLRLYEPVKLLSMKIISSKIVNFFLSKLEQMNEICSFLYNNWFSTWIFVSWIVGCKCLKNKPWLWNSTFARFGYDSFALNPGPWKHYPWVCDTHQQCHLCVLSTIVEQFRHRTIPLQNLVYLPLD